MNDYRDQVSTGVSTHTCIFQNNNQTSIMNDYRDQVSTGVLCTFTHIPQVLLITLQLAMPSVVRFAICTMIFYIAFLLCGWLVLGPYHPKVNVKCV